MPQVEKIEKQGIDFDYKEIEEELKKTKEYVEVVMDVSMAEARHCKIHND